MPYGEHDRGVSRVHPKNEATRRTCRRVVLFRAPLVAYGVPGDTIDISDGAALLGFSSLVRPRAAAKPLHPNSTLTPPSRANNGR
jgi:hypothetical protein